MRKRIPPEPPDETPEEEDDELDRILRERYKFRVPGVLEGAGFRPFGVGPV
jgi:hypothetical protein